MAAPSRLGQRMEVGDRGGVAPSATDQRTMFGTLASGSDAVFRCRVTYQARSWSVIWYPSGSAKVNVRPNGPSIGAETMV